jgi:hypothetical protein
VRVSIDHFQIPGALGVELTQEFALGNVFSMHWQRVAPRRHTKVTLASF